MKKKIILLYDFLTELGGLERVMFFQANSLKKKNDVELLFSYVASTQEEEILRELGLDKDIKIKQIGKTKSEILQFITTLLNPSRLGKYKADLFISHSFMSSRMCYFNKKINNTPYIVVIHHPPNFLYSNNVKGWVNNPGRFFAKILGIFLKGFFINRDIRYVRGASLVIANSRYTAERVKKIYNIDAKVLYPPVSDFFRLIGDVERKAFLKSRNIARPYVLAHGRVIPDKNYLMLIDIMKELPEYDLVISGTVSNAYRHELESKITSSGLSSRIRILGRISKEDLLGYYNTASLFLLPAPKEDFGLTPVEAMRCGCPVIAWADAAGPEETVKPKISGLLAKSYSLKDFIEKIRQAGKMKWDRKKISKYSNIFSEKDIGKATLSLINTVIKKHYAMI